MKYTTLEERLYEMNLGINQTSDISLTKYGFSYNMVDLKACQQLSNPLGIEEMPITTNKEEIDIDVHFRIGDKIKYELNKEKKIGTIKDVSKDFISVEDENKNIDKINLTDIVDVA